ncbi:MAG: DUF3179 domain-containing (seleno)protein [Micromonosporaceae bacterium]
MRRWFVVVVVLLSGCATAGGAPAGGVRLPQATDTPRETGPSALADPRDPRLPDPLVDPSQLVRRQPPAPGGPPLHRPRFQHAGEVGWLRDTEPVLAVTVGYETRGYPIQVMLWHEVVNDTVGGIPVATTYHPACNTGFTYGRRVDRRVLSFGASGWEYAGCGVLYDRQTETLWPQPVGRGAIGVLTGTRLTTHRTAIVAWRDFLTSYPGAWVLSRDTGHDRPYGRNPYPGYDDPEGPAPPGTLAADPRLRPMTRVVGLPGLGVAFVRSVVASSGVQIFGFGDRSLVAWHRPGQVSPLDAHRVGAGRDIGTVAVFDAVLDGRTLHFTRTARASSTPRPRRRGRSWDTPRTGRSPGGG